MSHGQNDRTVFLKQNFLEKYTHSKLYCFIFLSISVRGSQVVM